MLGFYLLGSAEGYAQQIAPLLHAPEARYGKGIEFGVDKITNTFVWIGNADIDFSTDLGQFRFYNVYRSSAFRTSTLATRDDEQMQLTWMRPLSDGLQVVARQGY
ncbi:MAG TPA: hypothetical protein VK147_10180, partial [Candidatus Didemnitutus sp.]|nr:hypothetical protein [Candidatus Didemnitutus sp.]